MLQLENPFWTFSLDVYARPGVADECLGLQARHGIDVNALLFCAWAGAVRAVALGEQQVVAIGERTTMWQQQIVLPLRGVRQTLKGLTQHGDPVTSLRKDVAAAELSSEQIEQAMLFANADTLLAGAGGSLKEVAVSANLVCFLRHNGAAPVAPPRLGDAALAFAKGT